CVPSLPKPCTGQGGYRIDEHNLQFILLNTTQGMSIKGVVAPIGANDASPRGKTSDEESALSSRPLKTLF
ncbi:MAG: hypothetical protein ACK52W_09085, partial [Alphaproteobacteria bacterium]